MTTDNKFHQLKAAVEALYYGAVWKSDRLSLEAEIKLWEDVRNAAGLNVGDTKTRMQT